MTVAVPDPALGARICEALRAQAARLGLSLGDEPVWADAVFETRVDPFSQEESRVGTWSGGLRYGNFTFFADGRIFAEYQVLMPLPGRAEHYLDSVRVWGTAERLRGDAVIAEFAK